MDKENLKKIEKAEKEKNEMKTNLKKKSEVLERVIVSNKRKYETTIVKKEKIIVTLEKQKYEIIQLIREKSAVAQKSQNKVKELYSQYDTNLDHLDINSGQNNSNINNNYNINAGIRNDQSLERDFNIINNNLNIRGNNQINPFEDNSNININHNYLN